MISVKHYEEKTKYFAPPALRFHGYCGHLRLQGAHQGTTLKPLVQMH